MTTVPHSTAQTTNICELDLIDVTSEENNFEKITTHSNESFVRFIGREDARK